jgi:CheY-like chemotaxis protein/GAF domain-containing protein
MSRGRVLVVDDERFFREAIADVLQPAGFDTLSAATGGEALELVTDPSVGVLVLDLVLPDVHGLEVFRRVRELRPDLRVIILSAHTDQDSVLEALRLGAFDYLAKPLHEEELVLAVRRALETWDIASGWSRLRGRIERLEGAIGELWSRARGERGAIAPEDLRELAVQAAAEVLGAAKTSLMLLDEGAAELRVAAAHGRKIGRGQMDAVRVGEGVAGLALARREPILVSNVASDERFRERSQVERYASGSFAIAPLVAGARAIGVLCAADPASGDPFDAEDLVLLRILAGQVAQMIEPAAAPAAAELDLTQPAPEPTDDLRASELARAVCEAVTAEIEPGRILDAALRPVARALGAAPVSLYLFDAAKGALVREAECDGGRRSDRPLLPPRGGLTGAVFASGQLVATPEPGTDPRFHPTADTPQDGRPGPLVCGALRFRGKNLGVFRAFPERAADASPALGEVLAAALSAAVRNVLLYRSLVETIEEVAEARREAGA